MDLSIYDKETIERARHRGRAYLCLACVHLKKKRVADELGKLEDHIVRNHVELERVPFYCQLCTFKCMKQGQFTSHLSQNKRHMFMCSQRQIQDSSHWKVVSPNPYVITEVDMQKLSQEESLRFFLERQTRQLSPLDEGLSKLIAGTLDADLTEDTLRTCAIPMTSAGNSQIPVPASTATTQPDRIPPTFQGMQQPAIQGVPPQQWPAISSLAMFQHPMTAPTWNPMMMSIMPQTATQPTTQPTQLAGQTWNPAMLPSAPQPATQPMTQPSPFTGPMWTPTTMSMVQQPATQPMMQQPATQPMMQQPATSPMMQQPATQPMMQQPATQTTMQQPAPSPMVQQPATQPTTQQPAVRIWNPAMMDTTVTSRSSFKPVTPAVDMEQGGAVGNQTVTVLTMGLDSSPRGSVSRASIGPLPTTPAPEREATPVNASTGTASPDDTSNAPGAFTEPTSQSSTLNEASQEPPTNVEETEAAELADPSEVVEDITGQLLEGEEMTLSSPVVPDERRRVEEKESGSKDAEAGQSTEGRSGATKGMKRRAMTEQEIRKRKVEKEMPDCKGDHQGENSEELVSVEEMLGKRRRTEEEPEEPTVRISLVAMNSLVSTLQSLKGQMARNEKASEKVEKGLTDIAVELSKVRDALYRWKDVAEGLANEEKRREERRIEADRRKEEDDRREREAERRRADRRREEERKDRQDLRQLLVELREERDKEKKRNEVRKDDKDGSRNEGRKEDRDMSGSRTRREDKEDRRDKSRKDRKDEDCEDKENTRVMRSALSRQYTENKVEDLTNKIL